MIRFCLPVSLPSLFARPRHASQRVLRRALLGLCVLPMLACVAAEGQAVFPTATAVGQSSAPLTVTVTMTAGGTAQAPLAETLGVPSKDFATAAGGSCQAGSAYSAGDQCTVNVVVSPLFPGVRTGAVVVLSNSGVVLGRTMVTALGTGSLGTLNPALMTTVAGSGIWTYHGDGVLATQGQLFLPTSVVEDAAGNLFIADSNNNRIRRVDAATGLISTVGGNGNPGYSGDGGPATQAMINTPGSLVMDGAGDLYFADTGNQIVRRIDAVTGIITTVAGVPGVVGFGGDGGVATSAMLSQPEGLALDTAQNLYIADSGNNVVRKVAAGTGKISTVVGTGAAGYSGDGGPAASAKLRTPWGVTAAVDGSLYIADLNNNVVRQVLPGGTIKTVAGTGVSGSNGDLKLATAAQLSAPAAVVLDPAGNLYIADSANNRVRKVSAASGVITTIAGSDSEQFGGDGGPATLASLYGPYALYFDQTGNLLIADLFHNRIRQITGTIAPLTFPTMRVGKISAPQPVTYENDGNDTLSLTSQMLSSAALDAATTTCQTGQSLAVDATCVDGVEFAPTVVGTGISGTVTVNSNSGNSPATVEMGGDVLSVNPTSITVSSSANPSVAGATVTFAAQVSPASPVLTGTITFLDGTTTLCQVNISAANAASCSLATLATGTHNITAVYSGDTEDAAATSANLVQTVRFAAAVQLSAGPNPAIAGTPVTLAATVTSGASSVSGSMTFYDGTTALGSTTVQNGIAILKTSALAAGGHSLTATYSGDTLNAPATSSAVLETVQLATSLTTLSSSNADVTVGTAITLSVSVASTNGPAPTGTVTLTDGATALATLTLDSSGNASFTTAALTPGAHTLVAAYVGDTDNGASSSAKLVQTVEQVGTATALSSDANPANAGQTVHLTAAVAVTPGATAVGAITGQVTFSDGAVVLGSAALDASGHAVLAISTLAVGSHSLTASFAGSTNYAASTSAKLVQTVQSTVTTTVGSSANNSTLGGQAVTLNATVSSATGTPTGTVTFYDGSAIVGTATLNAQGAASLSTLKLTVGTHTLTASYSGDANYQPSVSAPFGQTVSLAKTAVSIAGPTAPVGAGVAVSITGAVTSNGVAPTGTLQLLDGAAVIASQSVSAGGTYTFTVTTLALGSHTLSVAYSGDANSATAASSSIVVVVQQAATTLALSSSANPIPVGNTVSFTATLTSVSPNATGNVVFSDGGQTLATVAVANGVAVFSTSSLSAGTHILTAAYIGDANHSASVSNSVTQAVTQLSSTLLSSSANPAIAGASVTLTATVTGVGGVPSGKVVFSDGATVLATVALGGNGTAVFQTAALAVGSHNLSAAYVGDNSFAPSTGALIETVQSASTQVTLVASSNPATYQTALTLTATVVSSGGVATGPISFNEGSVALGTGTLNAKGVATLTLSSLAPGVHQLVASYAGDGKANSSVSLPVQVVVEQATTVVLASSANPVQTLLPVVLTATVQNAGVGAATGKVDFTDGSTDLGTATLDASGKATLSLPQLSAGSHALQASYAGDATDFASVSAALSQQVTLRPTTTAVTSTQTDPTDPTKITLVASVQYTGPTAATGIVTFSSGSVTLATAVVNASGLATVTIFVQGSGEPVVASYAGDTAYAASQSGSITVTPGPATQFTLQVTPASMTLVSGSHGTVTMNLASVNNYSDTLQFGCLGLPADATCTFSAVQQKLTANGSFTVQLTVDTGDPLGAGAQARLHSPQRPGASSTGLMCLLPAGLLAGLLLGRGRRRNLPALLLLFCALAGTLAATGCGGLQMQTTPVGNYSFKVTASGVGTGATQSQTMTLNVTK